MKPNYKNQMDYVYTCRNKEIQLTDEKTDIKHGKYFLVVCDKCCNIPVLHMLHRKSFERNPLDNNF
jgi:hypothetical protein